MSNIFSAIVSSISFSDVEVIHFIRENMGNTENCKEMEVIQAYHPETTVNSSLCFLSFFSF